MDRYESTRMASIVGIIGNLFLLCIKGAIGMLSGSRSMIADAANSASDIFASLMTFIGNKIASVPKDDTHNFGHGKAEYMFSMFISISMIFLSFNLLIDSATSLIKQNKFMFSWLLVVVCIITIIVKFILFVYTNRLYRKYNNILIKANMIDHRNDCIITTFTLISILLSLIDIYWFDSIVGIGISIWICFVGVKIFVESYNTLMDLSIDEKTKKIILNIISNNDDVKKVDDIYSAPVGYKYLIIIKICVDGDISTFESHNIASDLEQKIKALDKVYNVIIHVNPV